MVVTSVVINSFDVITTVSVVIDVVIIFLAIFVVPSVRSAIKKHKV